MKFRGLFKGLGKRSRRDSHKSSVMMRVGLGDYNVVHRMAKSRNISAVEMLHQLVVKGSASAILEDIMKDKEARRLFLALCHSTGIEPRNLEKIFPQKASQDDKPGAVGT